MDYLNNSFDYNFYSILDMLEPVVSAMTTNLSVTVHLGILVNNVKNVQLDTKAIPTEADVFQFQPKDAIQLAVLALTWILSRTVVNARYYAVIATSFKYFNFPKSESRSFSNKCQISSECFLSLDIRKL